MNYRQFFIEELEQSLKFDIQSVGYHNNQHDLVLTAKTEDGNVVGKIEYNEYQGKPHISWIEVEPLLRKQGIGKKMINFLQNQYPDEEIKIGGTTDLGTKFFDKLPKTFEKNERYDTLVKRLKSLQNAENRLNKYVQKTGISSERISNLYNDISDEIWQIEQELQDMSPGKTKFKETFISEDYPPNWNIETFKSIKSFSKRVAYCNQNLQRLASGSSRIAYKIDEEKVLKLAKNKKGIAQNSVERDWYVQQSYGNIVAKVYDVDENDLWLEMELAKKLTPSRFKALVGEHVDDVGDYLLNRDDENNGKRRVRAEDPIVKLVLDKNEWVQQIYSLCREVDLQPGDFGRISSYGEVIRDNKPAVVIIDLGLSKSVWNDFYGVT
jgi:predicted GNAT family acetyltransferase